MTSIAEFTRFFDRFAPLTSAESWDNVGLLVGRGDQKVERLMTCLTITPTTVAEAIQERADLIVSHHPLPFQPLKRLTDASNDGRLLLELIGAKIAVFSPHTAFDSAEAGINQRLANVLELWDVEPLLPNPEHPPGAGRFGQLAEPLTLSDLAKQVKQALAIDQLQVVGPLDRTVRRVGVACGSAGEFLGPARRADCDCLVTGEMRFHSCLEAESLGIAALLVGHYASERFGVEALAKVLAGEFPALHVWASAQERDPLRWL